MATQLTFEPGTALVAGGTGGIGSAICTKLVQAGVPVVFTYQNNETSANALSRDLIAAGGQCEGHRLNLADPGAVENLVSRVTGRGTRIGHVIYAAGPPFDFNFIGEIPNEDWHRVLGADVNGCFHLVQAAVKAFRAQGTGGNLIAITTSATERVPVRDVLSAAPKAAIEMLIRGVAKESGRFGIRANCVGPGWIDAGLGRKALEGHLTAEARKRLLNSIPLGRFGTGDDIANAVLFLCSKEASFISGQSLAVDGGAQV